MEIELWHGERGKEQVKGKKRIADVTADILRIRESVFCRSFNPRPVPVPMPPLLIKEKKKREEFIRYDRSFLRILRED